MRVPTTAVSPGARLARPIYGVLGQVLLREGMTLTAGFLKRLKELGVTEVYIEGGVTDSEDPLYPLSEETRARAYQILAHFAVDPSQTGPVQEVIEDIVEQVVFHNGILETISNISTWDTSAS